VQIGLRQAYLRHGARVRRQHARRSRAHSTGAVTSGQKPPTCSPSTSPADTNEPASSSAPRRRAQPMLLDVGAPVLTHRNQQRFWLTFAGGTGRGTTATEPLCIECFPGASEARAVQAAGPAQDPYTTSADVNGRGDSTEDESISAPVRQPDLLLSASRQPAEIGLPVGSTALGRIRGPRDRP